MGFAKVQKQLAGRRASKRGLLRAQNPTKSNPSPIAWKTRREDQYLSMGDGNIEAVTNHWIGTVADLKCR